jgi:hypothetical protein
LLQWDIARVLLYVDGQAAHMTDTTQNQSCQTTIMLDPSLNYTNLYNEGG